MEHILKALNFPVDGRKDKVVQEIASSQQHKSESFGSVSSDFVLPKCRILEDVEGQRYLDALHRINVLL
jgi:4-aminobutyrate aminotransferase-like enzyme